MQQTTSKATGQKFRKCLQLFPTFLMPLQQTTFKNTVTKEEIAQDEQFLLLPQFFQLFSVIIPTNIELLCVFAFILSKSSAAELLYVGKD